MTSVLSVVFCVVWAAELGRWAVASEFDRQMLVVETRMANVWWQCVTTVVAAVKSGSTYRHRLKLDVILEEYGERLDY